MAEAVKPNNGSNFSAVSGFSLFGNNVNGDSKLAVIVGPSYMFLAPERTANLFSESQPCTYYIPFKRLVWRFHAKTRGEM